MRWLGFIILLALSTPVYSQGFFWAVGNSTTPAPPTPTARTWTDLTTAVPNIDWLYIPDSSRSVNSSSGTLVTNGDAVKYIDDEAGAIPLPFGGDSPSATSWDSIAYYVNDWRIDSVTHWKIPPSLNYWNLFDNSVAGDNIAMPIEAFYVVMNELGPFFERFTSRGLTIEATGTGDLQMQARWNFGGENTFSVSAFPAENKVTIIRVQVNPSGWCLMWLNNTFLDSVNFGTTANASIWGLGTTTHVKNQRLYAYFGRWGGYFTAAERDSIYSIALAIKDTGVFPYYAATYNGSISFETAGNIFRASVDTSNRTGSPIDSVEAVLFVQSQTVGPGNWIDEMYPADTNIGSVDNWTTVLGFDGDTEPELSSNDGRYIWIRTRVKAGGVWGKYSDTAFLINNFPWD